MGDYNGVQKSEAFEITSNMNPNNVDIEYDILDYEDVSVTTNQNLPAGSPVLYVPNEMILSSHNAYQELGRLEDTEHLLGSLDATDQLAYLYLVVKILMEYERGEESPWYPWLNSLHRYYSNGASMTPFCYDCLPPLVASLAWKDQSNYISLDAALIMVPFLSDETKENNDLTKWAF